MDGFRQGHAIVGTIVHGEGRGRQLGYPTANLDADVPELLPPDGVYVGLVTAPCCVRGACSGPHGAAVSVGTNPTFDAVGRRAEAHLLDFTGDLYGSRVTVVLEAPLRGMVAFDGIDQLLAAMSDDVARARAILAERAAS